MDNGWGISDLFWNKQGYKASWNSIKGWNWIKCGWLAIIYFYFTIICAVASILMCYSPPKTFIWHLIYTKWHRALAMSDGLSSCLSRFCQLWHFQISLNDEILQLYQGPDQIKVEIVVSPIRPFGGRRRASRGTVNSKKKWGILTYERVIGS